jgi:hypothetical protein
MTFLEDLFSNKTISESSKNLYMSNLKRLNLNQPIVNLEFLKNSDNIVSLVSKYKPATKRSFVISVISVVKSDSDLYKTYFDLLLKINQEIKIGEFKKIWLIT